MKVVISTLKGIKTFGDTDPVVHKHVENSVRTGIMESIHEGATKFSKLRFRKLVAQIEHSANTEAMRIFDVAVRIIGRSRNQKPQPGATKSTGVERTAFSARDLGMGTGRFQKTPFISPTGSVNWQELTPRWLRYKQHHMPINARRFFKFRGRLAGQLHNRGNQTAWVKRFGGVQVRGTHAGALKERSLSPVNSKWILGELEVHIFPGISAALLPMLASNRWTADTGGMFEATMFRGDMRDKLMGPPNSHRPLIQPLVQFWIAFRIPKSIQDAINRTMKENAR